MRDEGKIKPFLESLRILLEQCPEQRFSEVICDYLICCDSVSSFYDIKDDMLIERIQDGVKDVSEFNSHMNRASKMFNNAIKPDKLIFREINKQIKEVYDGLIFSWQIWNNSEVIFSFGYEDINKYAIYFDFKKDIIKFGNEDFSHGGLTSGALSDVNKICTLLQDNIEVVKMHFFD